MAQIIPKADQTKTIVLVCPHHLCWGSPLMLSLSMSMLIDGNKFFQYIVDALLYHSVRLCQWTVFWTSTNITQRMLTFVFTLYAYLYVFCTNRKSTDIHWLPCNFIGVQRFSWSCNCFARWDSYISVDRYWFSMSSTSFHIYPSILMDL